MLIVFERVEITPMEYNNTKLKIAYILLWNIFLY